MLYFIDMEIIQSVNNEKVKRAASLKDKKFRRYYGSFLVEGEKLAREVLASDSPINIYIEKGCEDKFSDIISSFGDKVIILSPAVFSKIASTETPQGIVVELAMKETGRLQFSGPFLVLDNIQDPGNMGTIIRTAAAVGIQEVVMINCVDPYSPKVVRSSSGTITKLDLFSLSVDELEEEVKRQNAQLFVADMNGENIFNVRDVPEVFGLVVGSEGQGVSQRLRAMTSRVLSLPMQRGVESLNASVSASVLLYELLKHKFI